MGLHLLDNLPAVIYGHPWLTAARRWGADNGGVLFALFAAGLFAYINYLFWFYTQYAIWLYEDAYVAWYALRPPGYPAFLQLTHALTGDLNWLGVAQLNLLLASFVALAWGVARVAGSRLVGVAALLALCAALPLIKMSAALRTEALFTALICFNLAALCFGLRRASVAAAVAIGITIPLIYMTRPNGLPFAAALLLLLFIPPPPPRKIGEAPATPSRRKLALSAALPILAGLVLMGYLNKVGPPNGSFSLQTNGGLFLLGHVGYLMRAEDGVDPRLEQLHKELVADAVDARAAVEAADNFEARWRASTRATGTLLWKFLNRIDDHSGRGAGRRGIERFNEMNAVATELAWATIKARPWQYAELVALHYAALWRYWLLTDASDLPADSYRGYRVSRGQLSSPPRKALLDGYMRTDYYLDDAARTRHQALAGDRTIIGRWWTFIVGNRVVVFAALAALFPLSFALLLSRRQRRDPLTQLCAYLAFTIHAYAWLLATVHTTITRYTWPLLPLVIVFLIGMAVILWRSGGVALAIGRCYIGSQSEKKPPCTPDTPCKV